MDYRFKKNGIDLKNKGKHIGHGIDGRVFQYGRGKVLKITNKYVSKNEQQKFIDFLSEIKKINSPFIVKLFDWSVDKNGSICYVMQKLVSLNDDEVYKIDKISNQFFYGDCGAPKLSEIKTKREITKALKRIGITCKRYIDLVYFLNNFKYLSNDFLSTNVMKDKENNFVCIDLEQFFFCDASPHSRGDFYISSDYDESYDSFRYS